MKRSTDTDPTKATTQQTQLQRPIKGKESDHLQTEEDWKSTEDETTTLPHRLCTKNRQHRPCTDNQHHQTHTEQNQHRSCIEKRQQQLYSGRNQQRTHNIEAQPTNTHQEQCRTTNPATQQIQTRGGINKKQHSNHTTCITKASQKKIGDEGTINTDDKQGMAVLTAKRSRITTKIERQRSMSRHHRKPNRRNRASLQIPLLSNPHDRKHRPKTAPTGQYKREIHTISLKHNSLLLHLFSTPLSNLIRSDLSSLLKLCSRCHSLYSPRNSRIEYDLLETLLRVDRKQPLECSTRSQQIANEDPADLKEATPERSHSREAEKQRSEEQLPEREENQPRRSHLAAGESHTDISTPNRQSAELRGAEERRRAQQQQIGSNGSASRLRKTTQVFFTKSHQEVAPVILSSTHTNALVLDLGNFFTPMYTT